MNVCFLATVAAPPQSHDGDKKHADFSCRTQEKPYIDAGDPRVEKNKR